MLVRMGRRHNGMKRIGRGEDIVCREGRYGNYCRYFVLPRPIAATHVALIENIKIALQRAKKWFNREQKKTF